MDLDRRLRDCGAQEMPMYLSSCIINWKIGSATATLLLNIYVDDLALCGDERCHSGFWTELPQAVKLEPGPYILGRDGTLIIGRKHYLKVRKDHTTCMDTYCELTGFNKRRFRAVPAPRNPESPITDEGLSVTGEFGKNASRILMPLLWLSRLTWLDLSFIVPRLASRVTSRTKFEDKQPHRWHTLSIGF